MKAAVRMSMATHTGLDTLLKMPIRDFAQLCEETAEELKRARKK